MSILNQVKKTTDKAHKRLGRGYGSGKGKTVGRGTKGAGARKSPHLPIYFEGGQLPLTKRLPMIRGKSRFQSFGKIAEVNLGDLNKIEAEQISLETLKLAGLVDEGARGAKVIATGKLDKAIKLVGLRVSAGAKKLIEKAGGSVEA
ncbi:50S ribosomal protein L15 [bacterium]|nr:50S ribosomal protein L15 [bacterium]MBQ6435961.1 50S ribosomal protein L15 [bacterium]